MSLRIAAIAAALTLLFSSCGNSKKEQRHTPTVALTIPVAPEQSSSPPAPPGTTAPAAITDPCTLPAARYSVKTGLSFSLDPSTEWRFCLSGGAAGTGAKYLFFTRDGEVSWTLISETRTMFTTTQAEVGSLSWGGSPTALFFVDREHGWLGLDGPGDNLFRSSDGGRHWAAVRVEGFQPSIAVTSIQFSGATHGSFTTRDSSFTTDDGGESWNELP